MQEEEIFQWLFHKDEISWKSMIYDLVRSEQMDPWDIDITLLSKKFLQSLKKMKEMDLRISGKIILASAILLRLKSNKLMDEDITGLDSLIASINAPEDEEIFEELLEFDSQEPEIFVNEKPKIFPKTPQPRKRKVSVFDLVNALGKALDVHARRKNRIEREEEKEIKIPEKSRDMSLIIKDIYREIKAFFKKSKQKLTFELIIPSHNKLDMVYTFVPLLHLDRQRKIDLLQEQHFGEIEIRLKKRKAAV
ncbi:hypothetical protein GF327_05495 [Candidatus Woesearchaeota archaeon]|nr:hypothetical protein [Candidatus Woesearchaeota archaeon]